MPVRGGKYEVLAEEAREGYLETLRAKGPEGEGRLYWFEVHDPEARSAFFRYRNALKRLERLNALPSGIEISARPGRYYVFWPASGEPVPPKGRRAKRALAEIEAALRPFGYRLSEAVVGSESGRPVVLELHPFPTAPAEPAPAPRPRPALLSWLPGLLFALAGLLLIALGLERYFNPPSFTLPNLVNKPAVEAEKALRGLGLVLVFEAESDPTAPAGVILQQDPPPGTRLKPGRRVRLTYNRPETRQVPALAGKTRSEAEALLAEQGYRVTEPAYAHDASPPDTVLASDPPAGTPLAAGSPVRLLISLGPGQARTLVPNLEGTDPEEARALLELAGLRLDQEERLPSPLPEGTLLAQSPRAGTVIETGAPVVTARAVHPEVLLPEASPSPAAPAEPIAEAEPPLKPPEPAFPGPNEGRPVPLDVRLPADLEGQPVRLTVTDEAGTRVLYEGPTQKGWRLSGEVRIQGKATFRLYVGDYLYQEWESGP